MPSPEACAKEPKTTVVLSGDGALGHARATASPVSAAPAQRGSAKRSPKRCCELAPDDDDDDDDDSDSDEDSDDDGSDGDDESDDDCSDAPAAPLLASARAVSVLLFVLERLSDDAAAAADEEEGGAKGAHCASNRRCARAGPSPAAVFLFFKTHKEFPNATTRERAKDEETQRCCSSCVWPPRRIIRKRRARPFFGVKKDSGRKKENEL